MDLLQPLNFPSPISLTPKIILFFNPHCKGSNFRTPVFSFCTRPHFHFSSIWRLENTSRVHGRKREFENHYAVKKNKKNKKFKPITNTKDNKTFIKTQLKCSQIWYQILKLPPQKSNLFIQNSQLYLNIPDIGKGAETPGPSLNRTSFSGLRPDSSSENNPSSVGLCILSNKFSASSVVPSSFTSSDSTRFGPGKASVTGVPGTASIIS